MMATDLNIFYQTIEEYEPTVYYQRSANYPGRVAVSLQYMPALGDPNDKEKYQGI